MWEYGRKPNLDKINVVAKMKACSNNTKVRRFLGAYVFYHIWIPHFAHIA